MTFCFLQLHSWTPNTERECTTNMYLLTALQASDSHRQGTWKGFSGMSPNHWDSLTNKAPTSQFTEKRIIISWFWTDSNKRVSQQMWDLQDGKARCACISLGRWDLLHAHLSLRLPGWLCCSWPWRQPLCFAGSAKCPRSQGTSPASSPVQWCCRCQWAQPGECTS